MTLKRPMLACPAKEGDLKNLRYPKLASPKIDGVRALGIDGVLKSRKFIDIPNVYVQSVLGGKALNGMDGELVVGEPTDKNLMHQTMSGVMKREGQPDVKLYIFDTWAHKSVPYAKRARAVKDYVAKLQDRLYPVVWIPQRVVKDYNELFGYENELLELGYEGAIVRDPLAPYKEGRSTLKQEWMVKLKRFVDGEAVVIGTVEQFTNNNESTVDHTGYAKRSSHKAGKEAANMLGALVARDLVTKQEFEIGAGFTHEQRRNLWKGRQHLVGKLVKYKHFPIGVKDKPRHPVFLGWRDRRDM